MTALVEFFRDWTVTPTELVAFSAVTTLAYLVGRRNRRTTNVENDFAQQELQRATRIAAELERIARIVRNNLASHHATVADFQSKVSQLRRKESDELWGDLCDEVDKMLAPTLKLASQLSRAYDQIRQQTAQLLTYSESRLDPLTGLANRKAVDEQLNILFGLSGRVEQIFSIALFSIDDYNQSVTDKGRSWGEGVLKALAGILEQNVRQSDFLARYGNEEFVVLMPQTNLPGAGVFAERLRDCIHQDSSCTISAGIAEAKDGETPSELLSRVDSSLYSAKAAGTNCLYQHTGTAIRPYHPFPVGDDANPNCVDIDGAVESPEATRRQSDRTPSEAVVEPSLEQLAASLDDTAEFVSRC